MVRLGSVPGPPSVWPPAPHQHCLGVGSAGCCQTCPPPPWRAAGAPGPAASRPGGPGCPWTGKGRGQWRAGCGPGAGLNGDSWAMRLRPFLKICPTPPFHFKAPPTCLLPASRACLPPHPLAHPRVPTLLRPRLAFSPLSLSLTFKGAARPRSSGRRKGGFRRAASGSWGGSTTYLHRGWTAQQPGDLA